MTTTTGLSIHDQNLEKQIEKHMGGCMAGFFNIFDRSHLLSGKRLYPKRLPPSVSPNVNGGDSASESISIVGSPAMSMEPEKPELRSPAPENAPATPKTPVESSPMKSPWKFNREAPRLSLDSRAITDPKGGLRPREIRINTVNTCGGAAGGDDDRENQRRSLSVIARLMGLEAIPNSSDESPEKKVELRRSASESRSRDYRFFDTPSFLSPKIESVGGERKSDQISAINRAQNLINGGKINNNNNSIQNVQGGNVNRNKLQRRSMVERKSYYNTADCFPPEKHQNHQAVTIYGEIERRLRLRGIDEPSKDLETRKHVLEALQLKGLLHSSTATTTTTTTASNPRGFNNNNRRFSYEEESQSPVVLMKPRTNNVQRNNISSGDSPRRERPARSPMRSPGRNDNRSSSPVVRRKGGPLSVKTQRRTNETTSTTTSGCRRVSLSHSPVQSPKMMSTKRNDQTVNRSPRNRRSTVEVCQVDRIIHGGPVFVEDEVASTTLSESSFSTSSHNTDNERWRGDYYRDERNLLERCDKLLSSIAEITSSNSNSSSVELQQPSPVSVLDSSFYKEDESSPSPVKKRTIDFKDQTVIELEDELLWSPPTIIQLSKFETELDSSDDSEFSYVSEVIRASNYLPDDSNLFMLLEKQSSIRGNKDKSKVSILQRKLIFDTITEILDRNQQLPPWKAVLVLDSTSGRPTLEQIWSEFQKIREQGGPSEDIVEAICGMLKKDLAGDAISGWGDCPVEMSEAVLDIERLIYKDLIGETIRDLATFAGKSTGVQALRRKLVF